MSERKRDTRNTTPSTDTKKSAVLGKDKKRMTPLVIALVAAAVVAAGGLLFLTAGKGLDPAQERVAAASPNDAGEFAYPVSDFADGKAKFFSYRSPAGLNIRYFIIKSADGVIRAAFDTCDTCWSAGKGYRQEGDFMVCNNCGQSFASTRINEVKGGCNPTPLTRTLKGAQVIVKASDLIREGSFYFDFGRRG